MGLPAGIRTAGRPDPREVSRPQGETLPTLQKPKGWGTRPKSWVSRGGGTPRLLLHVLILRGFKRDYNRDAKAGIGDNPRLCPPETPTSADFLNGQWSANWQSSCLNQRTRQDRGWGLKAPLHRFLWAQLTTTRNAGTSTLLHGSLSFFSSWPSLCLI